MLFFTARILFLSNLEGPVMLYLCNWESQINMFARLDEIFEHGVIATRHIS